MRKLLPLLLLLAGCATHKPMVLEAKYKSVTAAAPEMKDGPVPPIYAGAREGLWYGLLSLEPEAKTTAHGGVMWSGGYFIFGVEGYPPTTRAQRFFAWFYFRRGWSLLLGLLMFLAALIFRATEGGTKDA